MPATDVESKKANADGKLERAVHRLSDLPTIPSTLLRIWELVDDPDSSASDLEGVISMDQALTAKIIRLVNSPYYGLREHISTCRNAITLLGFAAVRNLSVCVSVVSACLPPDRKGAGLDLNGLWRHCAATGVIAKMLATRIDTVDDEVAFTAGVLHDVGKFAMTLCLRAEYTKAVRSSRENAVPIREAEETVVGVDHAFFGGKLARLWGFPADLTAAIENHHGAPGSGEYGDLVRCVSVADGVSYELVGGESDGVAPPPFDRDSLLAFGSETPDVLLELAREAVLSAKELMNLIG